MLFFGCSRLNHPEPMDLAALMEQGYSCSFSGAGKAPGGLWVHWDFSSCLWRCLIWTLANGHVWRWWHSQESKEQPIPLHSWNLQIFSLKGRNTLLFPTLVLRNGCLVLAEGWALVQNAQHRKLLPKCSRVHSVKSKVIHLLVGSSGWFTNPSWSVT